MGDIDVGGVYSDSKGWLAAYKRDIIQGRTALSAYALESPSEGFAELYRAMHEYGEDAVKVSFPACHKFLVGKGLV